MARKLRAWRCLFLLISLALAATYVPLCLYADSFFGKVVRGKDGDGIVVMHGQAAEEVRLAEIDCPERGQAFGTAAKKCTSGLAFGKMACMEVEGKDRYGRTLGDVYLPDRRSLNRELVKAGMAWWHKRYSDDKSLGDLEAETRAARGGCGWTRTPRLHGSSGRRSRPPNAQDSWVPESDKALGWPEAPPCKGRRVAGLFLGDHIASQNLSDQAITLSIGARRTPVLTRRVRTHNHLSTSSVSSLHTPSPEP